MPAQSGPRGLLRAHRLGTERDAGPFPLEVVDLSPHAERVPDTLLNRVSLWRSVGQFSVTTNPE